MRLIDADALLDKFEWKVDSPLYIRIIRATIKAEPSIDAEPQWIPCSERLPETEDVYLVTHPDYVPQGCKQVDRMYYFEGEWRWLNGKVEWEKWPDPIIAWMPLPEPYKVKTEE